MNVPPVPAAPRRAAVAFIFITVVLDVLALGIIVPVLPALVVEFLDGDTARAAETYGVFATAWAFMQFIASPFLGALSDRFGRRPIILLSITGLGLDYILMAVAPTLAWLFVGRVIYGITSASFATAAAYIADVTPVQDRAKSFGLIGAAFGLGFVLGPAVGGIVGAVNPRLPFWIAAALCLANALYGLFVFVQTVRHREYFLPDEDELAFAHRVFAEDQPIIESQPPGVPQDRRVEVHVPADKLAVAYRRALREAGVPEGAVV